LIIIVTEISSETSVNIRQKNVITFQNIIIFNNVLIFVISFSARGKLKKILNPIILGLAVKGVLVLASLVGLIMKAVAAKAVLVGLAAVVFTAVAVFKKYSTPQGGTIYVHTNGGVGHTNGGSWGKEGYGPHRVSKDATGYQGWENYGRRQRGDYSTPAATGDRYYQYYNSYYKPNGAMYSTTMSPYIF
jgi:hypothetical protein